MAVDDIEDSNIAMRAELKKDVAERESQYGIRYKDDIIIDEGYFESEEFKSEFKGVIENEEVAEYVAECAKKSVLDNAGTLNESMYIIDADTKELIASIEDEKDKIEQGVSYTDEFSKALEDAKRDGRKIIAVHNHPEGFPPSIDDFMKAYDNDYYIAFAIGANGQVYCYTNAGIKLSKEACDNIHALIVGNYDMGMDVDRAYLDIYNSFGLNYNT